MAWPRMDPTQPGSRSMQVLTWRWLAGSTMKMAASFCGPVNYHEQLLTKRSGASCASSSEPVCSNILTPMRHASVQ